MVQAFLKKWWAESDFKAPNLPLSLRLKVSGCHYNSIYNNTWTKHITSHHIWEHVEQNKTSNNQDKLSIIGWVWIYMKHNLVTSTKPWVQIHFIQIWFWYEESEDKESLNQRRTDNTMAQQKRTKRQATINKAYM